MHLSVGDQLLVQFGTFGDRLISVVVDMEPGQDISIFLKIPDSILSRIKDIGTVNAQYVQHSTLMGFSTSILNYCSSPACVLKLAWPQTIESQDLRQEKRLQCNFPGTLTVDAQPYRCMVEDLSASGARVRILQHTEMDVRSIFEESSNLTLDFFVLEERNRYSFTCSLHQEFIKDSERYVVLMISEREEAFRRILNNYIQAVFGATEGTKTTSNA